MSETMIERVARAIANDNGDDFDAIPQDKQDWIANHSATGRFRDVNEPRRDDYLSMARAAIEAMREPSSLEMAPGVVAYAHVDKSCRPVAFRAGWNAVIDEALSQSPGSLPSEDREMSEILPCPFCGSDKYAALSAYDEAPPYFGYMVYCCAAGWGDDRGCGASSGWGETPEETLGAWNRRASVSPSLPTTAATPTDSANPPPVESVGPNSEAQS